MRILAVDVGTGTQDILLFDSEREIENCLQFVMPSPTQIVAAEIRAATEAENAIFLTGRTMGGGPCAWAAEAHLKAGHRIYAEPDAARTFDDDLERVDAMGVIVLAADEPAPAGARKIRMCDLDLIAIARAFDVFGVTLDPDAIAIAVFDHGNAPPGVSDRRFRFEYIAEIVARNDLNAFAYRRAEIPERLTRMRAAAADAPADVDVVVMDTGPAAVAGALEDPRVAERSDALIANLGNFHTLAFHVAEGRIVGLFEHHTGELTAAELETYLDQLADGTISNDAVFADMGHGALVVGTAERRPSFLGVTGPRRALLRDSRWNPYQAVPHGDMMLAGCFGLLRAYAALRPEHAPAINAVLGPPRRLARA